MREVEGEKSMGKVRRTESKMALRLGLTSLALSASSGENLSFPVWSKGPVRRTYSELRARLFTQCAWPCTHDRHHLTLMDPIRCLAAPLTLPMAQRRKTHLQDPDDLALLCTPRDDRAVLRSRVDEALSAPFHARDGLCVRGERKQAVSATTRGGGSGNATLASGHQLQHDMSMTCGRVPLMVQGFE